MTEIIVLIIKKIDEFNLYSLDRLLEKDGWKKISILGSKNIAYEKGIFNKKILIIKKEE